MTVRMGSCMEGSRMAYSAWLVAFRAYAVSWSRKAAEQALLDIAGVSPATAEANARRIDKACRAVKPRAARSAARPQADPAALEAKLQAAIAPALEAAHGATQAALRAEQALSAKADAGALQDTRNELEEVWEAIPQPKRPYWAWAAAGLAAALLFVAIWRAPAVQAARTIDDIPYSYMGETVLDGARMHLSLIDGEHSCMTPVKPAEPFAEGRRRHLEAVEAFRKTLLKQPPQ